MKISKVDGLQHRKKSKKGYMYKQKTNREQPIDTVIRGFAMIKSMKNRIVRKVYIQDFKSGEPIKALNESMSSISEFIEALCKGETNLNLNINLDDVLKYVPNENDFFTQCFTHYGQSINVMINNEKYFLKDLIKLIIKKENDMLAKQLIQLFKIELKRRLKSKEDGIKKSIENNKSLFKLDNGKLIPNTKRLQRLYSFIDFNNKKLDLTQVEFFLNTTFEINKFYEEVCKLQSISNMVIKLRLQNKNKENFLKIKNETTTTKEDIDKYNFFYSLLQEYVDLHFPIKREGIKTHNDTPLKRVEIYLEPKAIENAICNKIKNQIVSALITEGKLIEYYYNNVNNIWGKIDITSDQFVEIRDITSDLFEEIKIEESFKKQVMSTLSFAQESLKHILDNDERDFFNSEFDVCSINLEKVKTRITKYFDLSNIDDSKIYLFLEELKSQITRIRHDTYHHNKDALNSITNKDELKKIKNPISQEIFENDLFNLGKSLSLKIMSMNLYLYYNKDLIFKLLNKMCFSLDPILHNLRPSFENMLKKGENMFCSEVDNVSIKKQFDWFIKIEDNNSKVIYKNVLQLIYNYYFLNSIKYNEKLLKDAMDNTIKINETLNLNNSSNAKNRFKRKYASIKQFDLRNKSVEEIFKHINNELNENNKQSDDITESEKENKKIEFMMEFLRDSFAIAFNKFLNNNFQDIKKELQNPSYIGSNNNADYYAKCLEQINANIKIKSKIDKNFDNIALYSLFKIIGSSQLSEFKNQLIKYRVFLNEKMNGSQDISIVKIDKCIELCSIINILSIKNDMYTKEDDYGRSDNQSKDKIKNYYDSFLSKFIEDKAKDYVGLYVQNDRGNDFISHRNIDNIVRTGLYQYYINCLASNYKINKDDYIAYEKYFSVNNYPAEDKVSDLSQENIKLHKEILSIIKKFEGKENKLKFDIKDKLESDVKDKLELYKCNINKLSKGIEIKNKVTFTSLFRIYNIHMEILSRFVGYANDFEREIKFILLALNYHGGFSNKLDEVNDIFDEGSFIKKLFAYVNINKNGINNIKTKDIMFELMNLKEVANNRNIKPSEVMDVRNKIAHFHQIALTNIDKSISLIEIINKLRDLFCYDRKRKNAITKSIKELLEKENLELKFVEDGNSHNFKVESIKSKKIKHFKKYDNVFKKIKVSNIETDIYPKWFCECIEQLFNYKA